MKRVIEILPGIRIEVNRPLKAKAGIPPPRMGSAPIKSPDAAMVAMKRSQRKGVLYSRLLLDEAVALAKQKGMKEAARLTGVGYWSINQRQDELRGPNPKEKGNRYTLAQKRECVALAMRLMASPETVKHVSNICGRQVTRVAPKWAQRPAFVEAGKRLGMNGRSIEFMWKRGMLEPSNPQPASPPV